MKPRINSGGESAKQWWYVLLSGLWACEDAQKEINLLLFVERKTRLYVICENKSSDMSAD